MEEKLLVSFWPHIQDRVSTKRIMWTVFLSLIPSGIAGVYFFGLHALLLIFISIFTAIITEAIIQFLRKKEITISDGSAALTGLLVAYNLSPAVPFWIPMVGSFFAIAIAKQAFGGLGRNIFNPALSARVFLLLSWPKYMTSFIKPFSGFDTVSSATPLVLYKEANLNLSNMGLSYLDLFLGKRAGCIGEVAILWLLLGAVVLLFLRIITLHIPLSFLLSFSTLSWIFSKSGFFKGDVLFSLLTGGIILGAFFMATDYVSSPLTKKGKIIFGVGCGLLTFIIRRFSGYPEGVSFSILIMNAFVPLIDRYLKPNVYGKK
jgi:electron transport complex protein RnfD